MFLNVFICIKPDIYIVLECRCDVLFISYTHNDYPVYLAYKIVPIVGQIFITVFLHSAN